MSRKRPILLLEINEIPWSLLDRMARVGRWPAVAQLLDGALARTTRTPPGDELSPWITWPTLHRGEGAEGHGVEQLGQDVSTFRGVPIWEEIRRRGGSVGICGSLQSWPPIDPGPGGFHIPDTFASDDRCVPARVSPLQRLSLEAVGRNSRVLAGERVLSLRSLRLAPAIVRAGVRGRTLVRVARQLAGELVDRGRVARRPSFQTMLFWDVFLSLYDARRPPALATFFSNHVAGLLHRAWDDAFHDDDGRRRGSAMELALDVFEEIVGDALRLKARCPSLVLVLAGGMGQERVARHHEGRVAVVSDVASLLRALGAVEGSWSRRLAMAPQVALDMPDAHARERLRSAVRATLTATSRETFLDITTVGRSVSLTVVTPPPEDLAAGGFLAPRSGGERSFVSWSDAGITLHDVDAGTGGHVAEGVLAITGEGIAKDASRAPLDLRAVRPLLLELSGLVPV